jgi:hypothetical protein
MPPPVRKSSVLLTIGALILFCSCEKHHLGEYPEVQREQIDSRQAAKPAAETAPEGQPTPAEFFPPKKSP